jgi:hypothetical protein
MQANVQLGEKLGIVATIDPATIANTEVFSDVVDMSLYHQVLAIALLGNMASETIDVQCYTCDSGGSNATLLKKITQLAASATANDNAQAAINVRAEELAATSKQYIKFSIVTGGATGGPAALVVLAGDAHFQPVAAKNLASVLQVKAS